MEVVCKGRVRFDVEKGRLWIEPEGKGAEELQAGMRVWIVLGDPAEQPIPYRITPAGLAAIAA